MVSCGSSRILDARNRVWQFPQSIGLKETTPPNFAFRIVFGIFGEEEEILEHININESKTNYMVAM